MEVKNNKMLFNSKN